MNVNVMSSAAAILYPQHLRGRLPNELSTRGLSSENGDRFTGNMGDDMILYEGTFYLYHEGREFEKVTRGPTRSESKGE